MRTARILRLVARTIAALLIALVATFAVGEHINPLQLTTPELVLGAALLSALGGFAVLAAPPFRHPQRELVGGIISLVAISVFYFANWKISGKIPGGWVLPLFFAPGIAELIAAMIEIRSGDKNDVSQELSTHARRTS